MAITRLLPPKLIAIADAIRNKTGETELMTLEYMPEKIENIKGEDTLYKLLTDTLETYATDEDIEWGYKFTLTSSSTSIFTDIRNLKKIYIPNVTKTIATTYMFARMNGLEEVYAPKMIGNYGQIFNADINLKRAVLHGTPDTAPYEYYTQTFYQCNSLEYVEFTAARLARFNTNSLFTDCTNIKAFVLRNITRVPDGYTNGILGTNNPIANKTDGYVYVPANMVQSFENSSIWPYNIKPLEEIPEEYK